MSEWKLQCLGDLLDEKPRNGLYKPKEFLGSGVRYIKMSDLYGHDFIKDQETELVNVTKEEQVAFSCKEGDLLFGRTSLTFEGVGKCAIVEQITDTPVFESNVFRLRPNSRKANSKFLFYFFKSQIGRDYLLSIASQTAATSIRSSDVVNLKFPLPSLYDQSIIAEILSSLDNKIELKTKINKNLEELAQILFNRWFTDFEFPDKNGKPFKSSGGKMMEGGLGEIPNDWKFDSLGEILELEYGKALKSENRVAGEYPVVGSSGIVDFNSEYLVQSPGIVIGRKGTIGKVNWLHQNFFPIDTTFYVKDKENIGFPFLYFILKMQDFKKIGSDSAVPGLNRNEAYNNKIVIPPYEIAVAFSNLVSDLFNQMNNMRKETEQLISLRDLILPKIMSGQLVVNEK